MQLWIAGGGTGGHVYPGLAVAQALAGEGPETEAPPDVVYVGGAGGIEQELAERAGLRFYGIPAGGLHGLAPVQAARNLTKLSRGWVQAYRLGRRERPAAVFMTGGYASVPVALAARMLRMPILLYLPDIEPGQAVRFIARLATRIGVTVEESRVYLPDRKVVVTGYPVRAEFHQREPGEAREALGLSADAPVVLVFGGSRGARSINESLDEVLEQILEMAQIVHVSGTLDWPRVAERRERLAAPLRSRYHAFPYLHEIGNAFAAADLAVCRAGASTLGELPFFGLPAVLVPYPHAWRYQRVNADWLAKRGGALRVNDEVLSDELLPTLRRLLGDRERLAAMARQMEALARPDAASRLAEELLALASDTREGRRR